VVRLKDVADLGVQAFRIWDFMGFEDSDWIELRPINLLFGRNSTGKSAILHALLLLRQSLTSPPSREPLTLFSEDGIDAGSFQHIVHHKTEPGDDELGQDKNNTIAFAFKCRIRPELLESFQSKEKRLQAQAKGEPVISGKEARATLQLAFGPAQATRRIVLQGIEIRWLNVEGEDTGPLIFAAEWLESEVIDGEWGFPPSLVEQRPDPATESLWDRVKDFGVGIGFLPVLPELKIGSTDNEESDYDVIRKLLDEFRQVISGFLKSLHYLGPVRSEPRRFYYAPGGTSSRASKQGMNILENFLATWGTDQWERNLEWINSCLKELDLGIQLEVHALDKERKPYQSIFDVRLREDSAGTRTSLCDTGFGWSQTLPIVLECALAEEGATIIIEEPEAHLHPGAQAELGDLFIRMVKERKHFLIETHSEHLLLRIRRRVAETTAKMISPSDSRSLGSEDLKVYFVDRVKGKSFTRSIEIDHLGSIIDPPERFKGFFSDDAREVFKLTKAALQAEAL